MIFRRSGWDSVKMINKNNSVFQISKILLLTVLLLLETGRSSMSAKTAHNKTVVSNVPVKVERNLQTDKNINLPTKPDAETAEQKPDAKVNDTSKLVLSNDDKNKDAKGINKEYGYRNGDKYLAKYQKNSLVKQIILVEQIETANSIGTLFLLTKNQNGDWQENLQCKAYLGKNGIDKVREGDAKTPTGDFGMLMTFGAKDDPGSLIPYTKLTDTMYLCGDQEYYNQFIDVSKIEHTCSSNSEHLIRYIPQYNYALFFDFNKENIYGKGSAIFLHCAGNNPFTLGCVSVAEENMIKILRTVDINSRICIYAAK